MKITLVNPPQSLYDRSEIAPPLGLLRLAAAVRRATDIQISIIDFNLLYHTQPELQDDDFYESALARLLAEDADIYGFTSMAVDSHVALHLGRLIKQRQPDATIILGGTHFSSIAEEILENYSWINFVVKGEGEAGLRNFIENRQSHQQRAQVILPASKASEQEMAFPAYDLVDIDSYFTVNPRKYLNFEGGRGCRFKCSFCYSPVHYDGHRNFSIETKIEELYKLKQLGAKELFFVEDNFLNDPNHAVAFCRELENAGMDISWHCYATLPQLSPEVIIWMARAGCSGVFSGVDAVGEFSQKAYRKGFFQQMTGLEKKLNACMESGIQPTYAFLLSPSSHPCSGDTEETLRVALRARNLGAQIRLNTLTLYNQTLLRNSSGFAIEVDNTKCMLTLDVPDFVESNEYAQVHPYLFPFHSRYVSVQEWRSFISHTHCLYTLFVNYPQTLEALWVEKQISPLEIARKTSAAVGDLLNIAKPARRDAELLAVIPIFEDLTIANKKMQILLEEESHALLNSCEYLMEV